MANPAPSRLVRSIGACDLVAQERAAIPIAQRGRATRGRRVEPGGAERLVGDIDPPRSEILVDVAQDVRALHRHAERSRRAIGVAFNAAGDPQDRRHEATDRSSDLVAVALVIYFGRNAWTKEIGAHSCEKVGDGVARQERIAAAEVVEDQQLAAAVRVAGLGGVELVVDWRSVWRLCPHLDRCDAPRRRSAFSVARSRLNVDEIVKRAERQVEKVNITAHLRRQEARGERKAARDAIDGCPRLGEQCCDLWRRLRYGHSALRSLFRWGSRCFP